MDVAQASERCRHNLARIRWLRNPGMSQAHEFDPEFWQPNMRCVRQPELLLAVQPPCLHPAADTIARRFMPSLSKQGSEVLGKLLTESVH